MTSGTGLDQLIELTPGVCDGKPRIAGRRVTVQNIAIWHEHLGLGVDQIAADNKLTLAEVHAALAYYFAHRDEIEQSMREDDALAEAFAEAEASARQKSQPG